MDEGGIACAPRLIASTDDMKGDELSLTHHSPSEGRANAQLDARARERRCARDGIAADVR